MMPNCRCDASHLILSGGGTQCTNCMRRSAQPPRPKCTALRGDGSPCGEPHDPGFTLDAVVQRRGHIMCDYHHREAGRHRLPVSFWRKNARTR